MGKNEIDPLEIFLGGIITYPLFNVIQKYFQNNKSLTKYQRQWEKLTKVIETRSKKLREYKLFDIVKTLEEKSKEAYSEALGCYLCGLDLAASNMICFSLEVYFKEQIKKYDKNKSLSDIILDLEKEGNLQPCQVKLFHILREQRNIQAHIVNRIHELDLLGLFKVMRDVVNIFSPQPVIAEKNE